MTLRQHQLLTFIGDYSNTNGYMPTLREMAQHMGYANRAGSIRILGALHRDGHIRRGRYRQRDIEILKPARRPKSANAFQPHAA